MKLAADINSRIAAPTANTDEGNRSPAFIKKVRLTRDLLHLIKEAEVPMHERGDRWRHELNSAADRLEMENPGIKEAFGISRQDGPSL